MKMAKLDPGFRPDATQRLDPSPNTTQRLDPNTQPLSSAESTQRLDDSIFDDKHEGGSTIYFS